MDIDLAQRFSAYLAPGEAVRWTGRPAQGLRFSGRDAFLVPFSVIWCAFATFWEFGALTSGSPFMIVWGVPFVCAGLYFVFGRFFVDAWRRARTAYALTNTRALVRRGDSLTSIDVKTTPQVEFKQNGARGTISFGAASIFPFGGRDPWHASSNKSEFFQVEDAETAYRIIQSIKA